MTSSQYSVATKLTGTSHKNNHDHVQGRIQFLKSQTLVSIHFTIRGWLALINGNEWLRQEKSINCQCSKIDQLLMNYLEDLQKSKWDAHELEIENQLQLI